MPEDMDGWEYTGEKKLPVWGTWTVIGQMYSDGSYSDCDEVGDTYQLLPDKLVYKGKNSTGSAEIKEFDCDVVSPEYVVESYGPSDWKGNCILSFRIAETEVVSGDDVPWLAVYMESKNKMVRKIARCSYLLEKTGDYDGTDENVVLAGDIGMFNGVWEITDALRAYGEDRDILMGEYLYTENPSIGELGMENWLIRDFYMADREDPSVRKLVDAMEIKDAPFLYIYEFKEDFFWDKMILKDEDTVLLEKDGDFYWAERKGNVDYGI